MINSEIAKKELSVTIPDFDLDGKTEKNDH